MTQFDLLTYVLIIIWFMVCFLVMYSFFLVILLPYLYNIVLISKFSGLLLWGRICYLELENSNFYIINRQNWYNSIVSSVNFFIFWCVYFVVMVDSIMYNRVVVGIFNLSDTLESEHLVSCVSYSVFLFRMFAFFWVGGV